MNVLAPERRSPVAARRAGYGIAVLVNLAVLYLINAWPGWRVVPFLTEETTRVLPLIDASLAVAVAANLVFLVRDTVRVKAAGDLVSALLALAAAIALWRVFPVDLSPYDPVWTLAARTVVFFAVAGSAIAALAALVALVRGERRTRRPGHSGR